MNRFFRKGLQIGTVAILLNYYSYKNYLFSKFLLNKVYCESNISKTEKLNKMDYFGLLENENMKVYGLILNDKHIVIKLCKN